jgi:hypothetical protein
VSRPPCFQLNNFCPLVESIYQGTPLGGRRIPYQGGLYEQNRTKPICGAALLTENYLVTSAICFYLPIPNLNANDYFVMLGDDNVTDMTDGQEKFDVAEVKIHPEAKVYREGISFNDIALIKLKRPARLSPIIGSVCLPDTPGKVRVDEPRESKVDFSWAYSFYLLILELLKMCEFRKENT